MIGHQKAVDSVDFWIVGKQEVIRLLPDCPSTARKLRNGLKDISMSRRPCVQSGLCALLTSVHPNRGNRVAYFLSALASMMLFCIISFSISSVVYGIPFDRTSYPSAVTRITSSTNTAKFSSLE
jgi:hypothetical protein